MTRASSWARPARCPTPHAHRMQASVRIFHRFDIGFSAAAAPRSSTPRLLEVLREVYRNTDEAAGIFQTTLQNGNPVIHPAVTLLNAALIERTGGDFMFYEEGVTEAVGRLMKAVDDERLSVARALGVEIFTEPELGVRQGYMTESNYSTGYSTAPGFRGIKAQGELQHRYLTEDVGYSLVFLTDLAQHLSVPTPTIDAIIGSPRSSRTLTSSPSVPGRWTRWACRVDARTTRRVLTVSRTAYKCLRTKSLTNPDPPENDSSRTR